MKWIAAFFMVVNVAVYLWLDGHPSLTEQTATQASPDVNRQVMVLLNETDMADSPISADLAASQGALKLVNVPVSSGQDNQQGEIADGATTETPRQDVQENESSSAPASLTCFRIGPFRNDQSWQSAVAWMDQNGITYRHVVSEQRGLQAVRLYLGPFPGSEEAGVAIKDLESKQVDKYLYQLDNGTFQISLGYFTQVELAERYLKHLWLINVQAKSQTETRTLGPYNWMETQTEEAHTALLNGHNWPEVVVQLTSMDC